MTPLSTVKGKKVLIVGGIAYDHIMTYGQPFGNALTANARDYFSVSFTADTKQIHLGGCGGNIAYTLKLLGKDGLIFSTAGGKDYTEYKNWLLSNDMDISGITLDENVFTACCYIMTDTKQSQITFFYPGAQASFIEELDINTLNLEEYGWAIVAPDHPRRMPILGKQLAEKGIPYLFDPSQQIASIESQELFNLTKNAELLIVNEYEAGLIAQRIGITRDELINMVPNYVETHGERGCMFKQGEDAGYIMAIKPDVVNDPTGCGDAFRSGVLMGLIEGFSLKKCCQIGALAATYNVECYGTQNHRFTLDQFAQRYKENFGEEL
jgi:adenosine kinase